MKLNKEGYNSQGQELECIVDLLTSLNEKVKLDKSLSYISKEDCDELYTQFELLDRNIFDHKKVSIDSNNRLEELTFIMAQMTDLNFSQEATVREDYNHLDYIAISLNMMRERLQEKVNRLKRTNAILDAFNDLYLVTDLKGLITDTNNKIQRYFNLAKNDVIGMHIKDFLESQKGFFGIDITRNFNIHQLKRGYLENTESEVVLRVSGKVYASQGVEDGYCYKVESLIRALYVRPNDSSNTTEKQIDSIYFRIF